MKDVTKFKQEDRIRNIELLIFFSVLAWACFTTVMNTTFENVWVNIVLIALFITFTSLSLYKWGLLSAMVFTLWIKGTLNFYLKYQKAINIILTAVAMVLILIWSVGLMKLTTINVIGAVIFSLVMNYGIPYFIKKWKKK